VTLRPEAVWQALAQVMDPEIPIISVVDLGIIRDVNVAGGHVTVAMTPTFSGCPALAAMQCAVEREVRALGADSVEVQLQLTPPWTTDWMTAAAHAKLKGVGLTPPAQHGGLIQLVLDEPAACPTCGSADTELRNAFGPTLCRSLHYCRRCQQAFEAFKPL
jgi:ring-1,2-phenylacetyl-CoA epoxidase subunit PaaD